MIAELFLVMDLLKGTVVDTPISPPSAIPEVFKKKEKVIVGVKDVAGTAFGELKFKKYF